MKEIVIDKTNEGGRLDKLLFLYLDKASKSFVFKMLRKKNIILNGSKASGNEILRAGDVINIYFSDETINKFHSENAKHSASASGNDLVNMIIYEDENIIVLNKPSGLLSQGADDNEVSLNDMLLTYLDKNDDIGFVPGISNRLDRNTSGIIVAGKNLASTRELNELIKERKLTKLYRCIVTGYFQNVQDISGFITKDETKNISFITDRPQDGSKPVHTVFSPVSSNDDLSFVEAELITGRSHQIRAQLKDIGHSILGDIKYGDEKINGYYFKKYGDFAQLLHAYSIEFKGAEMGLEYLNGKTFIAPLPDIFTTILKGEDLWQHGTAEA